MPAPTTETNVAGLDGGGKPVTFRFEQSADNSLTPHAVLDFGGAAAIAPAATPAAASGLVLKAAPGWLFSLNLSGGAASGYFLLLDAAAVPANGPVEPKRRWYYDNTTQRSLDLTFTPPLSLAAGIVVAFSSTDAFELTLQGGAFIAGEVA